MERLPALASELVSLAPDLLLASSTPSLTALHRATKTIPIVFVLVTDPAGQGFVKSLAHPGGNVTGFSNFEFSMIGKWVELLKEIETRTKRLAVIFNPDTAPYTLRYLRPFEDAVRSFAAEPSPHPFTTTPRSRARSLRFRSRKVAWSLCRTPSLPPIARRLSRSRTATVFRLSTHSGFLWLKVG
jgi:putative ABC transport system substrate-binding protein